MIKNLSMTKFKRFILTTVMVFIVCGLSSATYNIHDIISNAISAEIARLTPPGSAVNVTIDKITPQILNKEINKVEVYKITELNNKITADLNLYTKNGIVKIKVDVTVRIISDVLTASRTIASGSVIHKEDLACAKKNIAGLNFTPSGCGEAAKFDGKISAKVIQSGKIISPGDFIKESMIKTGDIIVIEIQDGALKITTHGRAEENGNQGDIIKVRNMSSKKLIFCRVTGEGRVTPEVNK